MGSAYRLCAPRRRRILSLALFQVVSLLQRFPGLTRLYGRAEVLQSWEECWH